MYEGKTVENEEIERDDGLKEESANLDGFDAHV
jgi:hypothetical protein